MCMVPFFMESLYLLEKQNKQGNKNIKLLRFIHFMLATVEALLHQQELT